jgi:GNAT superfamily N-acetyltransferase
MEESDAADVVRCIYRTYGYTYAPLMYEPREIVRALRRGDMMSVVAETPAAGVVGHMAIFFARPGDQVPEAGRLAVDPRFRSLGIAGKMTEVTLELARERGVPGFWAESVTNHPFSQRQLISAGGAEVGLLLGGLPPVTGMVGFEDPGATRRATPMALYTPLNPTRERVHLPERHAGLIGRLIERLGLERDLLEGTEPDPDAKTTVSSLVAPAYGVAGLRVHKIGADVHERVADELEGLAGFDLGAVQLDLSLADPAAPATCEALERLGFSFAAWMPRFAEGSDGLRLQRIGSHPVETDVVCARPEGEEVSDYVLAEWRRVQRL